MAYSLAYWGVNCECRDLTGVLECSRTISTSCLPHIFLPYRSTWHSRQKMRILDETIKMNDKQRRRFRWFLIDLVWQMHNVFLETKPLVFATCEAPWPSVPPIRNTMESEPRRWSMQLLIFYWRLFPNFARGTFKTGKTGQHCNVAIF